MKDFPLSITIYICMSGSASPVGAAWIALRGPGRGRIFPGLAVAILPKKFPGERFLRPGFSRLYTRFNGPEIFPGYPFNGPEIFPGYPFNGPEIFPGYPL